MSIRLAIAGVIWAAILVIALQLVPSPAFAHTGHAHHAGDATVLAHHAGAGSIDHKAATRLAQSPAQTASVSATRDRSEDSITTGACTGCCCTGTVLVGSTAVLPDIGTVPKETARIVDRRSGIDPDGLARPPRILAL